MKAMRSLLSVFVVLVFLVAPATGLTLAGDKADAQKVQGEITEWNASQMQFQLRTEEGRELSIKWNDDTKVEGEPQVGALAQVTFEMNEGALIALEIRVV